MEENYALTSSVFSLLKSKLEQLGSKTALSKKNGDKWQNMSYAELGQRACNLANYLIESGIQSGDRIAILSESRPEWSIGLFAGILAGAIVVILDPKLNETELNSILTDCVPRILFTSLSNQNVADKLKSTVVSIEQVMPIVAFQFLFSIGDATLKVWPVMEFSQRSNFCTSRFCQGKTVQAVFC